MFRNNNQNHFEEKNFGQIVAHLRTKNGIFQ